jgi:hypothetical protein
VHDAERLEVILRSRIRGIWSRSARAAHRKSACKELNLRLFARVPEMMRDGCFNSGISRAYQANGSVGRTRLEQPGSDPSAHGGWQYVVSMRDQHEDICLLSEVGGDLSDAEVLQFVVAPMPHMQVEVSAKFPGQEFCEALGFGLCGLSAKERGHGNGARGSRELCQQRRIFIDSHVCSLGRS